MKEYCQGTLDRSAIEEILGIGKTGFFALLRQYRPDPEKFSLTYQRETPTRLSASVEKELIDDSALPITSYDYSAIRDLLAKRGSIVSSPTIIERAKGLGCYQAHPRKKVHDREVVTTAIGALIQHDASHHRWSPYAKERWALITSLDDFSRKLLYADFFEQETTWTHIKASEALMEVYGIPLRYYVDSLRVFRFVQKRDSFWRTHILQTDEANPQWKQVMKVRLCKRQCSNLFRPAPVIRLNDPCFISGTPYFLCNQVPRLSCPYLDFAFFHYIVGPIAFCQHTGNSIVYSLSFNF